MPTPSAPNTEPRHYSFTLTCPDTDDPQVTHSSSWRLFNPETETSQDSIRHHMGTEEDDLASRSTTMSPSPLSDSSDGPVHNTEAPSPAAPRDGEESHKHRDNEDERTKSLDDVLSEGKRRSTVRRCQAGRSSPNTVSSHTADADEPAEVTFIGRPHLWGEDIYVPSMGFDYPYTRVIPTSPSSFLRAGSRFHGTQHSEKQVYDVQVEIKQVDMRESFLCGYLRIQGLTEDHPTLTTYFEGEIIGTKYGFMTKNASWGASDQIDYSHWSKFPAFKPFSKQARKGSSVIIKDVAQREHIFMRWKEHFLVPDHRVRTIIGASFEGFYYICFNQILGEINGIYFHTKSERFQQLELKHVPDKGCFGSTEFR